MVDETTPGATPGEPLTASADTSTPRPGATTPGSAGETATAEPPLKNAGDNADAPGGPATGDRHGTTRKIKDEASKLGSQAADRARGFAGENKERATGALDELSKMMLGAAGDVDEKLGPQYGKYARSAAEGVQGFSDRLRSKEVDELFDDVQAFVRKSPAIAVGTAAMLGFVMARLIKSGVDAAGDTSADTPAT